MSFRRIYAIPDLHGADLLLGQAIVGLACAGYDPYQDRIIFLGDYIDRGPDSKGVLTTVKRMVEQGYAIALRGNHEQFAIDYYTKNQDKELWMMNGGARTEWSYPDMKMSDEHIRFLSILPHFYECQGFYFSHAPVPRDCHRNGRVNFHQTMGVKNEEYTDWERTWHYFGPECEKKGAMMDVHEGPRSCNGTGGTNLIGIAGHIHRLPFVKEVRIFPSYRLLDCGAGCLPTAPLAVHECISNTTMYFTVDGLRMEATRGADLSV